MVTRDLDSLEAQHAEEECKDAQRALFTHPRPLRLNLPQNGDFPQSKAWLERFYEGGRMVREKKPGVFDHLRSVGPWFVSVDDDPLSVLDGMSQTATVPAGFADDRAIRHYVDGGFGETLTLAYDTSLGDDPATAAYAERLRELVPGLPHVTFVNSGAESVEKAFALCHGQATKPSQCRVLGFEGSFGGRTFLALQASFNPVKRAPFEIAGYEVSFVSSPGWVEPNLGEPAEPQGFAELVAAGDIDGLVARFGEADDALLQTEVRALAAAHAELSKERYFAVIIEPMQSEGGDRYATARFHRGLRLLTRHHEVPLIIDEVQCGFGLGGGFAWHHRFGYVDAEGGPDTPDCVTFAKRAQVGVVMSRFEDPEPTSAHSASLIRGTLHAQQMATDDAAARLQQWVMPRLDAIAARFGDLVANPRACGNAFAFDMPSPQEMLAFLGQRFWRGVIVFGAGKQTIRYRLSSAFGEADVDRIFDSVRASLKWIEAHPGEKPPLWQNTPPSPREGVRPRSDRTTRVRKVGAGEPGPLLEGVLALEARVYEPARRDPEARLRLGVESPDGVAIVAEVQEDGGWRVVGSAIGVPLEAVGEMDGPDRDPHRGLHDTLYSVALTLDPDFRGVGLGRQLKTAQIAAAAELRREDGSARYVHVVGRNRVGETDNMMRINRSLGAYEVYRLTKQYGESDGEAIYYRIPVGVYRISPTGEPPAKAGFSAGVDLASGLARPFAVAPASLRAQEAAGQLYGPAVSKITICNYITPTVVRAVEWVSALTPELPHLYLTSSRDEAFDKPLRVMRYHRPAAQIAIGFQGSYFGHTTAAARSLSDPEVHRQGPAYFDHWQRIPHPAQGAAACVEALRAAVGAAGGPDAILALCLEPLQERTGAIVPDEFWPLLEAFRAQTGVPVIFSETASSYYRSGQGAFFGSGIDFCPDALGWWAGGQAGFVHVDPKWFVDKPLTFVSTWDGDELSMIRAHHQLRAARRVDFGPITQLLDAGLADLPGSGGRGYYRTVPGGEEAAASLEANGFRPRAFPNGVLGMSIPLDIDEKTAAKLIDALQRGH